MSTSKITSAKVSAWIDLLRAHNRLLSAVERALKVADLPPLGWYDVLLELYKSDNTGLRPKELESRLLLPQYGLSRLLDRMEAAQLLERRAIPEDRRSQTIHITEKGLQLREEMWTVYSAALKEFFADKLTTGEARTLSSLLERFVNCGDS